MALPLIIVVLAVADGILHLALNFVLFQGNLLGPLPFASPLPLPFNVLFTLNFVGYLVLAAAYWFGVRRPGIQAWVLGLAMAVYSLLSIIGWLQINRPNPMGLGYISKAMEIALIGLVIAHLWRIRQTAR